MKVKLIQIVGRNDSDRFGIYVDDAFHGWTGDIVSLVNMLARNCESSAVRLETHRGVEVGKWWPQRISELGVKCELPQPIGAAETKSLLDRIKALEAELEATQVQLQVDTDMFRGDLNASALALSKAKKATEEAAIAADFACGERDERMERIDAAAEEIERMIYIHFGAKIGVNATGVRREDHAIIRHLNQLRNQLLA